MDDSEKPFACPSPGCNMSFTNEDHLVVHKKKHDMVLNLGNNGKNTFVADQTPTPTRFIRNCEEVGLFQDLQNVNPFEETFRRAVEDGKTVTLSESEGTSADDTLHTPHIFPNMESTAEIERKKLNKDSLLGDDKIEPKRPEIIVETKRLIENCNSLIERETQTFVAPKITHNLKNASNLSINGQEVQLLLKTADGKMMQLSAVPLCEERQENYQMEEIETRNVVVKTGDSSNITKKNTNSNNRLSLAKMKLKQTLTKNGSVVSKSMTHDSEKLRNNNRSENSSSLEHTKKQDVLARNRASSMRARAKRKAWIQQLQKAATTANEKNAALQLEVKSLKNEVAKLRALLLAHANCPVTKSMEKAPIVSIEKSAVAIQGTGQNVQSRSSVLSRRKKIIPGETPIAPKIAKLSIIHPPILPKVDSGKHSLAVEDLPGLKLFDVGRVDSEPRKILFLEHPKQLELVRTPQLIRLNPASIQIENAASKCTGT